MLSNVEIHCGWSGGFNAEWVKAMVANGERVSLRDLQLEALIRALSDDSYPYLWWFYEEKNPSIRTVYEDSLGVNFVKLNGVWQVVYNCKKLGSLVGASGHSGYGADYEKIPPNAYFVVMENEDAARRHFTG
ncbi:hypothetical protein FC650_06205 [Vibrio natriegens]|uniref:hypothetical protein n=1 Tax=Vibrio natriegens TaxID=691 RepID=UPI00159434EC|nr:hypothetical protein [Vibrio natriegens]NVC93247.1 hypothetical protein [Vibrio natriegens]